MTLEINWKSLKGSPNVRTLYKGISYSCVLGRYPLVYGRAKYISWREGRELLFRVLTCDSVCNFLCTFIASKYAFTASDDSKHAPSGVEGVVETTTIHWRRQVGNFRWCRSVSWVLNCLQTIYQTRPLGSVIATTRIGTQKKRFQVRYSYKASHFINISVQVVIVGWTLHKYGPETSPS